MLSSLSMVHPPKKKVPGDTPGHLVEAKASNEFIAQTLFPLYCSRVAFSKYTCCLFLYVSIGASSGQQLQFHFELNEIARSHSKKRNKSQDIETSSLTWYFTIKGHSSEYKRMPLPFAKARYLLRWNRLGINYHPEKLCPTCAS